MSVSCEQSLVVVKCQLALVREKGGMPLNGRVSPPDLRRDDGVWDLNESLNDPPPAPRAVL